MKVRRSAGTTVSHAALPAANQLPFLDPAFTWERFEEFCHHFVSLLPKVTAVHRYGTQGSEQKGIDIAAELASGDAETYQCKRYSKFNVSDTREAIKATKYKAKRHTIVATCTVGTPVRDLIRKHRTKWRLWDTTDIALRVRQFDTEDARTLLAAHFGPDWAERFLGISALATFQSPGLYYAKLLDPAHPFHHALRLVGRNAELDELHKFIDSKDDICVLPGIGGSGKSRLMLGLFETFRSRHPDWHIRVVTDGIPVTANAARELPTGDCVILVEDAHRRFDVPAILSLLKQRPGRTKVVFTVRQYGVPALKSHLAWAFPIGVQYLKPLARLKDTESIALAKQALGKAFEHYAEALAAATGDSPLVLVVGGYLLKTKAIHPELLERHQEFRDVVLSRFTDEATAHFVDGTERDFAKKLLPLVAALQPIRVEDSSSVNALAKFVSAPGPDVARVLGSLEDSGVLLRRGSLVRIVPDVLGDYILHRQCRTDSGISTGYADRIFQEFFQRFGSRVLQNLAELDWRIRAVGSPSILDQIWLEMRKNFEKSPHSGRSHLLQSLHGIAFLQADRVLPMLEFAVSHPSKVREKPAALVFGDSKHEWVTSRVPSLLREISLHQQYFERCCELLWRLGRDDERPINGDQPIRVLQDVAGFDIGRPYAMTNAAMTLVEKWAAAPDGFSHVHSPIDVLKSMMAKEGTSWRSNASVLTATPFLVDGTHVKAIQERGIALLGKMMQRHEFRAIKEAIECLDHVMQPPHGLMGIKVTDADVEKWAAVRLAALNLLGKAAALPHPLAAFCARKVLLRHSSHRPNSAFKEEVKAVFARVNNTYELRVARALLESDLDIEEDERDASGEVDWKAHDARRKTFRAGVANEFISRSKSARHLGRRLSTLIAIATRARIHPHIAVFWEAITDVSPNLSSQLVKLTLDGAYPNLLDGLACAMRDIAEKEQNNTRGDLLVAQACKSKNKKIRWAAAQSLRNRIWPKKLAQMDLQSLTRLLGDRDLDIKRSAVWALLWVAKTSPSLAINLVSHVDLQDNVWIAAEVAQLFVSKPPLGALGIARVPAASIRALLRKLEPVASIDDHHLRQLIDESAERYPNEVVDLILARLTRGAKSKGRRRYEAIPLEWHSHSLRKLSLAANYTSLLRRIRDHGFALPAGPMTRAWLTKLFAIASNDFDHVAQAVLLEWINSANANKIEFAALLLHDAGGEFIFKNPAFLTTILQAANAKGEDCFMRVRSSLLIAARGGEMVGRSRTVGTPCHASVNRRDQAKAIAATLPRGSVVQSFFDWVATRAEAEIADDMKNDAEMEFE